MQRAHRYVAWLRRHAGTIIALHLLVAAVSVYLVAFRLPLFADFSYLLPQDAPAVQDLRRLEGRVKAGDTILVVIQAPDPATREAVQRAMVEGMRGISSDLIEYIDDDDPATRAYVKAHEFLLVDTEDLREVDAALAKHIADAKARANPLFIDLEDKQPDHRLDEIRAKRRRAEAMLARPRNVSEDGRTAMIQVRTGFRGTDAGKGEELLQRLGAVRDRILPRAGVTIGVTGGIVTTVSEHEAIFKGMVLSSVITALLVSLVLALYFRSATLLVLLIVTLAIATTASFGAAALTVGHLNAATAFLGAIIAGNGINYGILLIARYLEERRRGGEIDAAMARAIAGTLRPTLVASLGASIAYGSLAATSFKGFADFAVIGAIGMTLCWAASYVLLPVLVLVVGRHTRVYRGDPVIGSLLVRVLGFRRSGAVCLAAGAIAIAAIVVVGRYIAADPFEYDIKQLRSEGEDAVRARSWMAISDKHFGRGYAGRTVIAADRPAQVPLIVDALRARDRGVPLDQQTIGSIESLLTVVPYDQDERIRLLARIRTQLEDNLDELDDKERAELAELMPPPHVDKVSIDDLPAGLRDKLTEKDGRVGLLVSIRPANKLDEWNGHDLIRFADAVRTLKLRDGETITTSGASVIFADILHSIERDGPLVTGVAAIGLVVMVLLIVGRNRRSVAVLVATMAGSLLMVAICALIDLRVNFLDFVALPITLGLGVDYAINVAHGCDTADPIVTLRTSGSAVLVCSLTTIIGYGSLLVSDNLAIRGFGAASLIGEITCLLSALVLVPALLSVGRRRLPEALAVR